MKYKTLADLKAAYDLGELSKEHVLSLDNDSASVTIYDWEKDPDGDEGETVFHFDFGPQCLLEEALKLLNIPAEGV